MTREKGNMSLDLFKKIIDEYAELKPPSSAAHDISPKEVSLHHFGESLLSPIFDLAIDYARSKGIHPYLSINPAALSDDKIMRLLNAKPYALHAMIDGYDEESFSHMRGVKGAYEKTKLNTLKLLKVKNELKSDTKIFIGHIDVPGRELAAEETKLFWERQQGVDGFFLKEFEDWNGSVPEISQIGGACYFIEKCNFPWTSFSITWDGTVVPCCYDYDKLYPLGNVNQESLADIWNGENIKRLRREFDKNEIANSLCINCARSGSARLINKPLDSKEINIKIEADISKLFIQRNKVTLLPVRITNNSAKPIKGRTENLINASYHIVDEKGAFVIFDGARTRLVKPIAPNESVDILLRIDAIQEASLLKKCKLIITLVQEGHFWFDQVSPDFACEVSVLVI
jgi:radical SAM protein with 4Fe4S-binding SPASM domain